METRPLRFLRRGQPVTLGNVSPDRTLLDLLRDDLGSTGTKEGCGEGDCGACTVVLGERTVAADGSAALRYRAINSCIRLAHSIDGMALWTVEDLAADPLIQGTGAAHDARALHPAQEAMVACHGSQCGFCTPGFVMSLFGMYQNRVCQGQSIDRTTAQEDLSGNLCRCTGYRPILDAAQQMAALPPVAVDEAAVLSKLELLAHAPPAPEADLAYESPATLAALLQARADRPQAQLVAGCTDVGLWVTKQHRRFAEVLDVTRAAELRVVERSPARLRIGAAVTLHDAYAALVQEWPQLYGFATRFAGLPVRNSGTLGGNVANGSPIGDSMPLLIALGAQVVLASMRGERALPLEDLYTGYRQNVIAPDEIVAYIDIPLSSGAAHSAAALPQGPVDPASPVRQGRPQRGEADLAQRGSLGEVQSGQRGSLGEVEILRAYKISKRTDDDISAVCLVLNLTVADGVVQHASIGAGGVAATPVRARRTEAALVGQPWTPETVRAATGVLQSEFQPISDMRASGDYRRTVLGNLLQRFWLESQGLQQVSLDTLILAEQELP